MVKRWKKKPKQISLSKAIKLLDTAFSKAVRQKWADRTGWSACYTCGKRSHWKGLQNGHYISRKHKNLRWEWDNCRPQCVGCNMFKGGEPITFRENLVKELGETRVLQMESLRFAIHKVPLEWYEERLSMLK